MTYLAEVATAPQVELARWAGADPMEEHPFRLTYARPGGPAADLAWADAALEAAGLARNGPAAQVRTWNLSSIWRLPSSAGPIWLKVVPPFFSHEGAMIARLDPAVVPPLLAADGPRVLLADVRGEDHWGAEVPVLRRIVEMLVGLQACGLLDTLVHGDFHPGNTRGSAAEGGHSVLLDWGDCGIGQPLLDQAATLSSIWPDQRNEVRRHWSDLWRSAAPNPEQWLRRAAAAARCSRGRS